MARVAVCMPVFNDWEAAEMVVARVRSGLVEAGRAPRFLLVDDGSADLAASVAAAAAADVEVVRLTRNLGHQRAIAIGLAHLADQGTSDTVVVMDADGEDIPEHVPALVDACEAGAPAVAFAQRRRRSESTAFRAGYLAFKFVHRLLTGRPVEVGNFSAIPPALVANVASVSEIWVHYAAGVAKARVPVRLVPLDRGPRLAGRSRMNVMGLVGHGLGALSIFGEEIAVRLLAAAGLGVVLTLVTAGAVAVFGHTSLALVLLVCALVCLGMVAQGVMAAIVLFRLRSMQALIPRGDAVRYIASVVS